MTPANWIKKLRMTKEIKQTTIARKLGVTQQAYSKMENGPWISKQRLHRILDAMGSTLDELNYIGEMVKIHQNNLSIAEEEVKYIKKEPKQKMRA